MKRVVVRVFAVLLGAAWGFFVAFNAVFSDVFGIAAMAGAVGFVAVAYAVLGAVFGLFEPETGWRWALWLAPPGVILVVLQIADAPERALYHAAIVAAAVAGSGLAAAGVARTRPVR